MIKSKVDYQRKRGVRDTKNMKVNVDLQPLEEASATVNGGYQWPFDWNVKRNQL